ncbi:hypothetical protein EDD15DRAFT_2420249 [Pisolithus albus]|nr:hypothetical protein EDD15DRAFT_2420249 [Pisolithus albus]
MPSGRIIRPMRMRPERPLEPMHAVGSGQRTRGKTSDKEGKKREKRQVPPSRARRRTIDPTKWDSTYLTGAFLDAVVAPSSSPRPFPPSRSVAHPTVEPRPIEPESDEEESNDEYVSSQKSPAQSVLTANFSGSSLRADIDIDIRQEISSARALLDSMFREADEWGGSESAGEFDSIDGGRTRMVVDIDPGTVDGDQIEEVPRHVSVKVGEALMHSVPSSKEWRNSWEDVQMGDTHSTACTGCDRGITSPSLACKIKTVQASTEREFLRVYVLDVSNLGWPSECKESPALQQRSGVVQTYV